MVATRPAPTKSGHGPKESMAGSGQPGSLEAKQLFISSAIAMSWQMAVAVLIPIVGGYYLDSYFKSSPWITLLGVALAFVLVWLIVKRTVNALPDYAKKKGGK